LMNGLLKKPIKLVKISYTYQDKNKTQMDSSLTHDDYIENED
jgi:hypothetical protein